MSVQAPGMAGPAVPAWLLAPEPGLAPCAPNGRRLRASFIEGTLAGSAAAMNTAMTATELADRPGLLQRLDPRAKLVAMLVVLVGASLVHVPAVLGVLLLGALALAWASRLPMRSYLGRVLLIVPLFTLVVVTPAMFSPVTPGEVVLPLWTWDGQTVGVTAQGVANAVLMIARVTVSVAFVLLLTLTTAWNRVLAGLRGIGLPRVFVMIISMAYRYIHVLLASVTDMFTARRARSLGRVRHDAAGRRFAAAGVAVLFARSGRMSEDIHAAMVARGYRGDPVTMDPPRMHTRDWLALGMAVLVAVTAVSVGALLGPT